MKMNKIIYWIATTLIILIIGLGSIADFLKLDAVKESTTGIGFPLYIIPFLGTMKVLGTIVILIPALSRFKEAAYAGLIFYFIRATYCHIAVGDGADKFGTTLFILAIIIVSYIYSLKIKRT